MLSVWFHIKQNFCNDSLIWRLCQLFCKIFGKSINNKQNWESDLIWIFFFRMSRSPRTYRRPCSTSPAISFTWSREGSLMESPKCILGLCCLSITVSNIRQTIIVYACVLYINLMANSWIHSSRPIKILDKLTFGIGLTLTIGIHNGNWVQIKLSIESNILENRRIRWGEAHLTKLLKNR